jgi:hypothetical protein
MTTPRHRAAPHEDVSAAPPHVIAERIGGALHLSPRPGGLAAATAAALGDELGPPFRRGRGGPGGWILLAGPALHLGREILVPDLAGWRRERMPVVQDVPYFTLPPDWICEVVTRGTEALDRARKLPIYAARGVGHAWIVSPAIQLLEVLRCVDGHWLTAAVAEGVARVRAEPFGAIELALASLWADHAPAPVPPRAPGRAASSGIRDRAIARGAVLLPSPSAAASRQEQGAARCAGTLAPRGRRRAPATAAARGGRPGSA